MSAGSLSARDLVELLAVRRSLHASPELSGREEETSQRIASLLERSGADEVLLGLGGHGVAGIYRGGARGKTVVLRGELDALPIRETGTKAHRSKHEGVAHSCGHDGHMTILLGVARSLERARPGAGQVVLLFQPAEETGEGMARILEDGRLSALGPDLAFALHNLPGHEEGAVLLRQGTFACASKGLRIELQGNTAHAAWPETGRSPAGTLARLLQRLPGLAGMAPRGRRTWLTPVHARLGEEAFGVAPGEAVLLVTLRAETDEGMEALERAVRGAVTEEALRDSLAVTITEADVFPATVNDGVAVETVLGAATRLGFPVVEMKEAMRASEDFGRLAALCPLALFGLGAGTGCRALHDSSYDFPESLVPRGVDLFLTILEEAQKDVPPHAG